MKKVLLFDTALATSNLGDEIILESVKNGMAKVLDQSMCFRLATHIENYSPVQMLHPGNQLSSICFEADYKFVAGTNLLSSNLLRIRPQWWVNIFNKKIYENSILVGVGKTTASDKIENNYTKRLYNKILSKRYKHSVRDFSTKALVESMGFQAINTGCPTLWCFNDEKNASIPQDKKANVIFSVSGYDDQKDLTADREMLTILFSNYDKCFAWIQTTQDELYLNSLLSDEEKNRIVYIYSLNLFSNILNTGEVDYVGTRLHGGIYALQHSVRSIIVSIDHRAEGFNEANNIPIIQRTNINKLGDMINSKFETNIVVDRNAIDEFVNQFV